MKNKSKRAVENELMQPKHEEIVQGDPNEQELETRRLNMANILAGVFRNFSNYGLTPRLIEALEDHPASRWHGQNGGKITMQELAEFMLQVAGYIFSPKNREAGDE